MTSFVSVCVCFISLVCERRWISLPTKDSAQMAVAVVCVHTPFHMCQYIPRRCVEDLQSAGLMLLLFKLRHSHTHKGVFLAGLEPGTFCEQ